MKTDWNKLLSAYKGNKYDIGAIVNYTRSLEGDVSEVLDLVAKKISPGTSGDNAPWAYALCGDSAGGDAFW